MEGESRTSQPEWVAKKLCVYPFASGVTFLEAHSMRSNNCLEYLQVAFLAYSLLQNYKYIVLS